MIHYDTSWTPEEKTKYIQSINQEYTLSPERGLGIESASGAEYIQLLDFLSQQGNLQRGFIEIGSAWGASFHLISTLISGPKISVDISIDMNQGIFPWPPGLDREVIAKRNNKWISFFQNVHSILGYSNDLSSINQVAEILQGHLVDFLYIDAEHSYKAVQEDFINYKRFVRKGGIVGFHDIQLSEGYGMDTFWSEIKKQYKGIELVTSQEQIGLIVV